MGCGGSKASDAAAASFTDLKSPATANEPASVNLDAPEDQPSKSAHKAASPESPAPLASPGVEGPPKAKRATQASRTAGMSAPPRPEEGRAFETSIERLEALTGIRPPPAAQPGPVNTPSPSRLNALEALVLRLERVASLRSEATPAEPAGGLLGAIAGGGGIKALRKTAGPVARKRDPTDVLADKLEKQGPGVASRAIVKSENAWRAELTEAEYAVVRGKGTDAAHTGEYDTFKPAAGEGHFACRACLAPLYSCTAKFESGCGWPAFDRCYEGAIEMVLDTSHGLRRVELLCCRCGGHLGHVFLGEMLTANDERHCVNSTSIKFVKGVVPSAKEGALTTSMRS